MIDPSWIALAGVAGGGLILKGVEVMFKKKNVEEPTGPKPIIAKEVLAALDKPHVDNWKDKAYVESFHLRQLDEESQLGKTNLVCFCSSCLDGRQRERERKRRREEERQAYERKMQRIKEQEERRRHKEERYRKWAEVNSTRSYPAGSPKPTYNLTLPTVRHQ